MLRAGQRVRVTVMIPGRDTSPVANYYLCLTAWTHVSHVKFRRAGRTPKQAGRLKFARSSPPLQIVLAGRLSRANNMMRGPCKKYVDTHEPALGKALADAITQAAKEQAPNAMERVGELLLEASKSASPAGGGASIRTGELAPSTKSSASTTEPRAKLSLPKDESATDKWNLVGWTRGTGVHRAIAGAILRGAEDKGFGTDSDAALAFLRSLQDESELAALFGSGVLADTITEMLWPEVRKVQAASAATTDEVMGKFAGAIELTFGGLDKFFGGLEGALSRRTHAPTLRPFVHALRLRRARSPRALSPTGYVRPDCSTGVAGGPNPKVHGGMEADHLHGPDADDEFVTGCAHTHLVRCPSPRRLTLVCTARGAATTASPPTQGSNGSSSSAPTRHRSSCCSSSAGPRSRWRSCGTAPAPASSRCSPSWSRRPSPSTCSSWRRGTPSFFATS